MNIKRILLPTDFSECAEAAVELATALARDHNAEVILLHVDNPFVPSAGDAVAHAVAQPTREELLERLERVKLSDPLVITQRRLASGDPSSEILRFAQHNDVDLIVLGTHGRNGVLRALMGSTSESVVRGATCPVATIRPDVKSSFRGSELSPSEYLEQVEQPRNYTG